MLRSANDKRRWDADDWRRYRCRSETCDWQGLLAVPAKRHKAVEHPSGSSTLVRVGRTMLVLLLAGGLSWVGMQTLQYLMGG